MASNDKTEFYFKYCFNSVFYQEWLYFKTFNEFSSCHCIAARQTRLNGDLHFAAMANNSNMIISLVGAGHRVNVRDPATGFTPLHVACDNGHAEAASVLLQLGANPNAKCSSNSSPLHLACWTASLECVKLLQNYGAKITGGGLVQNTELYYAVQFGQSPEIVQLLLDKGAKVANLSHYITSESKLDCIKLLVRSNQDTRSPEALHRAVEVRRLDIVKLLVAHGADVNARHKYNGLRPSQRLEASPEVREFLKEKESTPSTLQHLCRLKIRSVLGPAKRTITAAQLDLPWFFTGYLQMWDD